MTDYNHDPIVPRTGAAADLTATVVKASVQNEFLYTTDDYRLYVASISSGIKKLVGEPDFLKKTGGTVTGTVTASYLSASHPVFTDANKNLVSTGTVPVDHGGTGQTSYTDGQLLIGNTTGNTLSKATLTASTGISITNGSGSITIKVDLGSGVVDQATLKTSTGEVSTTSSGNYTLPGGEYGFYPQLKTSASINFDCKIGYSTGLSLATYTTNIYLAVVSGTLYAQQRYVTSSGEVFWVFVLRDKATKKTIAQYAAPDHPCFGNGGKPDLVPHPFPDYNSEIHEIVVITLSQEEIFDIESKRKDNELNPSFLEVINRDFEIDEETTVSWPSNEITVGLPYGHDWKNMVGKNTHPIKMVIKKPNSVLTKKLKVKE